MDLTTAELSRMMGEGTGPGVASPLSDMVVSPLFAAFVARDWHRP